MLNLDKTLGSKCMAHIWPVCIDVVQNITTVGDSVNNLHGPILGFHPTTVKTVKITSNKN